MSSRSKMSPEDRAQLLERIAHGMRSPLGVLSHAVQTMQAELGPAADSQRYAALAGRALRRLELMADRLSAAAATDHEKMELYPQRVDLAEVVRRQIAEITAIEGRRELQIDADLHPCDVHVDVERLQRAVFEMLVNAVQHARRRVSVVLKAEDGRARLAIEDDGEGVPEAIRPTLFDGTTPSRSGLGLGLTTARRVVAAHDGSLAHEANTPGARFVLTLPLLQKVS